MTNRNGAPLPAASLEGAPLTAAQKIRHQSQEAAALRQEALATAQQAIADLHALGFEYVLVAQSTEPMRRRRVEIAPVADCGT